MIEFRSDKDEQGAYIDIIDDDNDYVTLQKIEGEYYYRIRGPVAEALGAMEGDKMALEESLSIAREQRDHAMTERDELLYSIIHTKAMKRFLSKRKREEN